MHSFSDSRLLLFAIPLIVVRNDVCTAVRVDVVAKIPLNFFGVCHIIIHLQNYSFEDTKIDLLTGKKRGYINISAKVPSHAQLS